MNRRCVKCFSPFCERTDTGKCLARQEYAAEQERIEASCREHEYENNRCLHCYRYEYK